MLIKRLKLNNIRSYVNEEINFPKGITLLSGDIGTGKSSILLAIDFALFGIRRTELTGASLLRNGCTEGVVELNFSIGDNDYLIRRILKKGLTSINQEAGFLSINGEEKQLTTLELKQKILDLLNYPADMLTKKSLIYRYTVYTPQEQMKHILLGNNESRIDTLRKVFNIDKYKIISNNAKILSSHYRDLIKENTGATLDLDKKINERILYKEKDSKVKEDLLKVKEDLEIILKQIETRRVLISQEEEKILLVQELKKNLQIIDVELKNKSETKTRLKIQLERINKEITDQKIPEIDESLLKEKIEKLKQKLEFTNLKIQESRRQLNECNLKSRSSEEITKSIIHLDTCPTCRQNVSEEYKQKIINLEETKINEIKKHFVDCKEDEKNHIQELEKIKENLDRLRIDEKNIEAAKIKKQDLENKTKQRNELNEENHLIDLKISDLNKNYKEIQENIIHYKDLEIKYLEQKSKLDELLTRENEIKIKYATLQNELENTQFMLDKLHKEIQEKQIIKQQIQKHSSIRYWLDKTFINLMGVMERKVMLKVHSDFNALFQKWCSTLMDTELIVVKLDEEFTPLIEQNGHDIDYVHMSGGEKTSIALAYRLALNQVINNQISSINTRDLIILDEPTDGFSNEQLDNLRVVLKELNMAQVIIVSHETKIESYVDNVIKLYKNGHISETKHI